MRQCGAYQRRQKISLQNSEEEFIKPVPFEWEAFRYGRGFEDVKLFYSGRIINLATPPTFFGEYNYLPSESVEALITIEDVAFHYGQLHENEAFELCYYDMCNEKYLIIGGGKFEQIFCQELKNWNTEMFVSRYSKKLDMVPDKGDILIDVFDAFGRLGFVHKIKPDKSFSRNLIDILLVINKPSLSRADLVDLLDMVKYISYGSTRYKMNFISQIDKQILRYKKLHLEMASWNNKEFFTVGIRCICK